MCYTAQFWAGQVVYGVEGWVSWSMIRGSGSGGSGGLWCWGVGQLVHDPGQWVRGFRCSMPKGVGVRWSMVREGVRSGGPSGIGTRGCDQYCLLTLMCGRLVSSLLLVINGTLLPLITTEYRVNRNLLPNNPCRHFCNFFFCNWLNFSKWSVNMISINCVYSVTFIYFFRYEVVDFLSLFFPKLFHWKVPLLCSKFQWFFFSFLFWKNPVLISSVAAYLVFITARVRSTTGR